MKGISMSNLEVGAFANAALLTPDRIANEGPAAFTVLPRWVGARYFHHDGRVSLELGQKYRLTRHFTLPLFALACELTRDGRSSLVVNPNSAGKGGTPYVRLIDPDKPEDLVVFLRVAAGAGEGQRVTALPHSTTIAAESAIFSVDSRAKRDARELAMEGARRRMERLGSTGLLRPDFDVHAYHANLEDLFRAIDAEAVTRADTGAEDGDPFEGEELVWEEPLTGSAAPAEGLGKWNARNPATVARFDRHYRSADNSMDFSKLTAELVANLANGTVDITPDTREYVKFRLQVSDQFIDTHLRDVVAGWMTAIDGRLAERRKARLATRRQRQA